MAKKKRGGRTAPSFIYYIVEISGWDWSYGFSVNVPNWEDRRYSDYRHLLIRGKLLFPGKVRLKAGSVEMTFMPDVREADFEPHDRPLPRAVGHLDMREGMLTGGFSMAADALGPVMQMLLAGRLRYAVLYGEPIRYRKALIRSYDLQSQLDPEEYPDVQCRFHWSLVLPATTVTASKRSSSLRMVQINSLALRLSAA